jgi:hypothetical protein
MDAQDQEYSRFGPWAIEITSEDPPPPLFVPYLTRSAPMLLGVKIPRLIERRDAHPGMDLYDYLICLYEDDLVVLQRVEREVHSQTCRYRDVQLLRVARHLLHGIIHLDLPGRSLDLPYSTVSDTTMLRIVDLVRQRYARRPERAPSGPEVEVGAGELSFYFEGLLATERRQATGMRLLAAQGTVPVGSRGMTVARRSMMRIASKRLLESMHLTDGRELKIVDRGQAYAHRWQSVYGADTCYIPVANVRDVTWNHDPGNAATVLTLRTGPSASVHVFAEDNPTVGPYGSFLSALPNIAHETRDISAPRAA